MPKIKKVEMPEGLDWPSPEEIRKAAQRQRHERKSGFSFLELVSCFALSAAAVFALPQLYVHNPDNLVAEKLSPHTWGEEFQTFAESELTYDQFTTNWNRTVHQLRGIYGQSVGRSAHDPLDENIPGILQDDGLGQKQRLHLVIVQ